MCNDFSKCHGYKQLQDEHDTKISCNRKLSCERFTARANEVEWYTLPGNEFTAEKGCDLFRSAIHSSKVELTVSGKSSSLQSARVYSMCIGGRNENRN